MPNFRMLPNGTAELLIMSFIGGEDFNSLNFNQTLQEAEKAGATNFLVKINSGGGDVFEGLAIYNALAARNTEVVIEGLAASMASVIAMAGKKIRMNDNAIIMIHNPWQFAGGDAAYFEKVQKNLEMLKDSIGKAYARTGLAKEDLSKMMDEETWMNANEALNKKFVDEVIVTNAAPVNKFEAMNRYFNSIFNQDNKGKVSAMLKIQNALGLAGAGEDEIVVSIQSLKKSNADFKAQADASAVESDTLKKENEDLKKKLKDFEDAQKTADEQALETEAESVMNSAIKDGKILPAHKDMYKNMFKADKPGFEKFLASAPVISVVGKKPDDKTDEKLAKKRGLYNAVKESHEKVTKK